MPLEIEHKFLVKNNNWKNNIHQSVEYKQGYLSSNDKSSIRIRISDDMAWLNIKSITIGTARQEYEYQIPLTEGQQLIDSLCQKPLIEKIRHFIPQQQHMWEVDVFSGDNEGLIVAEIELSVIGESFFKPNWLGEEVTQDFRYYNNNLSKSPYKDWK